MSTDPHPAVPTNAVLAVTTAPDEATARKLAYALLEARAAACINLLPSATSMYWWEGEIDETGEVVLMIKTTRERIERVKTILEAEHPYEVPELIVTPIQDGSEPYLRWLVNEVAGEPR